MESTVRVEFKPKNHLLIQYRKGQGYTQQQMADLCNVPIPNYNRAENLHPNPFGYMERISNATGIPIEKLFPEWSILVGSSIRDSFFLLDDEVGRKLAMHPQVPSLLDYNRQDITNDLKRVFNKMKPRDAEILAARFGLFDQPSLRLQALSEKYGLSISRIVQLCRRGLDLLRKELGNTLIREYLHTLDVYGETEL